MPNQTILQKLKTADKSKATATLDEDKLASLGLDGIESSSAFSKFANTVVA